MLVRRSFQTAVAQAAWLVSTAAVFALLTRALGPAGQGQFTFSLTLLTITATVSGAGVGLGAMYWMASRREEPEQIVATALGAALISSALALTALGIGYGLLGPALFAGIPPPAAAAAILAAPFLQIGTTVSFLLLGLNRPVEYAAIPLLQMAATLLLVLGLALSGRLSGTSAVDAWAAACALTAVGGWLRLRMLVRVRLELRLRLLRGLAAFGVQGYLGTAAMVIAYRLDVVLLNSFRGLEQVGSYVVAVALAEVIWYVSAPVALVLLPKLSAEDPGRAGGQALAACRMTLALSAAATVLMFAGGPWLIPALFGPGVGEALPALWLLLPGVLALAPAKVISSFMNAIGKPGQAALAALSGLPVTLAFDLALIPRFGIEGAAVSSSVTYLVIALASIWFLRGETGAGLREVLLLSRRDIESAKRAVRALPPLRSAR